MERLGDIISSRLDAYDRGEFIFRHPGASSEYGERVRFTRAPFAASSGPRAFLISSSVSARRCAATRRMLRAAEAGLTESSDTRVLRAPDAQSRKRLRECAPTTRRSGRWAELRRPPASPKRRLARRLDPESEFTTLPTRRLGVRAELLVRDPCRGLDRNTGPSIRSQSSRVTSRTVRVEFSRGYPSGSKLRIGCAGASLRSESGRALPRSRSPHARYALRVTSGTATGYEVVPGQGRQTELDRGGR